MLVTRCPLTSLIAEAQMSDTTIMKIDSAHAPTGKMGERHLAMSKSMGMRLWNEEPTELKPAIRRDYETIGYVISGSAELHSEGQLVTLKSGDSWVVPKGAEHSYRILDTFTAVEVTHPPAAVHGRDD
jgi:quercetin dioxygenase-like cupin family protein